MTSDKTERTINIPDFRPGDTISVHNKILEGTKERVQIFQGVVTKRHKGSHKDATFTVRKVSFNVGVERTFYVYSPRIAKIEMVTRGKVRRARLFYLRPLRGKATRIKNLLFEGAEAKAIADQKDAATAVQPAVQPTAAAE